MNGATHSHSIHKKKFSQRLKDTMTEIKKE